MLSVHGRKECGPIMGPYCCEWINYKVKKNIFFRAVFYYIYFAFIKPTVNAPPFRHQVKLLD